MTIIPDFDSVDSYVSNLGNNDFWSPYIIDILKKHSLYDNKSTLEAGSNPTYPTFLFGDLVLKLFGFFPNWRQSYESERIAYLSLVGDPKIAAPRMLFHGNISDDISNPWPYLITARVYGTPWSETKLSSAQEVSIVEELGQQIERLQTIRLNESLQSIDLSKIDVVSGALRSSFPKHLISQIEDYLEDLGPNDEVFVHGDLVANHLFVSDSQLIGIIDWGDATLVDRHYELAKLFFDTFRCNKSLLNIFLEASNWPVNDDFHKKALGYALYRQATGLMSYSPIVGQVLV